MKKILDMGLARIQDDGGNASRFSITQTGMAMGTVDYMAPEQADDMKKAGPQSDIYSLGCTLYFLLIGEPVFKGATLTAKLLAHRDAPIPDTAQIRTDVPAGISRIISKMLDKHPSDRFQSMEALLAAIDVGDIDPAELVIGGSHPQDEKLSLFLNTLDIYEAPTVDLIDAAEAETETPTDSLVPESLNFDPGKVESGGFSNHHSSRARSKSSSPWLFGGILCVPFLIWGASTLFNPGEDALPVKTLTSQEGESPAITDERPVDISLTEKAKPTQAEIADWLFRVGAAVFVQDEESPVEDQMQFRNLGRPIRAVIFTDGFEVHSKNISKLSHVESLETLRLDRVPVGDEGIMSLSNLKELRTVYFQDIEVTAAILDTLIGWTNLENFKLTAKSGYEKTFDDDFFTRLLRETNLTTLTIANTLMTEESLKTSGKFSKIQTLNIDNCVTLCEGSMESFLELPELRTLQCRWCGITDDKIETLSRSQLRELWLWGNPITEGCLPDLVKMSQLRELHIQETQLSEESVRTLSAQIPACWIYSMHGIFKNGEVYIPEE